MGSDRTDDAPPGVSDVVSTLGLEPLPHEGGLFRQSYVDAHSSAIYFLLRDDDFSALHRLAGVEVYHFYLGDPLALLLLRPDGSTEVVTLGVDLADGQRPQVVVPAGVWQGSSRVDRGWGFSLVGTTMSPAFDWQGFELGDRESLCAAYPDVAPHVVALTRLADTDSTGDVR